MDWETPCPKRADRTHCVCWYDGDACCACGDGALSDAELVAQGSDPRPESRHAQCTKEKP